MIRCRLASSIAAAILWAFTTTACDADIELKSYVIDTGATYIYKPSPESPGIPGGQPNDFQLNFGLSGTFDVEYDRTANTAALRQMQLALTGNEAIQMNPPALHPVTADLVEDWLEARLFENLFVAAPWDQYQSDEFDNLYFFDFLQGSVRIEGGFDHTPADGIGMQFNVNAHVALIPEPAGLALGGLALMMLWRQRAACHAHGPA